MEKKANSDCKLETINIDFELNLIQVIKPKHRNTFAKASISQMPKVISIELPPN